MLDAAAQRALAERLRAALAQAGIVVRRGLLDASNNRCGWEDVSAEAILGILVVRGWYVGLEASQEAKVLPFTLVRDEPVPDPAA